MENTKEEKRKLVLTELSSDDGIEIQRRLKLILNYKHLQRMVVPVDLNSNWEFTVKNDTKNKSITTTYLINTEGKVKRHKTHVMNNDTGKIKVVMA